LASCFVPFGQFGKQPMAGQTGPDGGAGGVQTPGVFSQLHEHGGQGSPDTQAGHAQAQPPPLPPPDEPPRWHTPERQVCPTWQGTPSPNHWQEFAVSAVQLTPSVCRAHASTGVPASSPHEQGGHVWPGAQSGQAQVVVEPRPSPPLPPLDTPPPATHPQLHAGHVCPASHGGQAHAQVPLSTQPASGPVGVQSHAQGGHDSPGAHEGQAQVQLPPPPPPEQSHSIGGQAAPAGQNAGLTQPQPVPATRVWQ
jgi:hypothetical protein